MKLEIEIYDLYERLYMMEDNQIKEFLPRQFKLECRYHGGGASKWGEFATDKDGKVREGYPIRVYYCKEQSSDGPFVPHEKLFRTKEELLNSLLAGYISK
jgi:hypothetical protein